VTAAWTGRVVTTARAYWRPRLPLPCHWCGKPVYPDQPWVVEHITPRSQGGSVTDPANQWVSHRRPCSDVSGAKMGAAITNARKRQPRLESERGRGIRGI